MCLGVEWCTRSVHLQVQWKLRADKRGENKTSSAQAIVSVGQAHICNQQAVATLTLLLPGYAQICFVVRVIERFGISPVQTVNHPECEISLLNVESHPLRSLHAL